MGPFEITGVRFGAETLSDIGKTLYMHGAKVLG